MPTIFNYFSSSSSHNLLPPTTSTHLFPPSPAVTIWFWLFPSLLIHPHLLRECVYDDEWLKPTLQVHRTPLSNLVPSLPCILAVEASLKSTWSHWFFKRFKQVTTNTRHLSLLVFFQFFLLLLLPHFLNFFLFRPIDLLSFHFNQDFTSDLPLNRPPPAVSHLTPLSLTSA